jgi:UDP-N-acetylglucosamine 2-epimerase (non-hydrolysing)
MKKIFIIFGTRPEAIKMAPIIAKLKENNEFLVKVCVTSQHRKLLDQVLKIFHITPDYDLDIMQNGQTLFDITSRILLGLEPILKREKPDIVLAQGDTSTAFAAALASFYLKIKVAHIEAGLRTYDKYSPFPEEINRKLITTIADVHFAHTDLAKENLLRESVLGDKIFVTGNSSIDALQVTLKNISSGKNKVDTKWKNKLKNKKYLLVTAHRRENFGSGIENICNALLELAKRNKDIDIVYPVHPNPNIQNPARAILSNHSRIHLVEPLDYVSFIDAMDNAYLILTDSGGIQEEAISLGKPILILRDTTERIEAVVSGLAILAGTQICKIIEETQRLLDDAGEYSKFGKIKNPYGEGDTADKIAAILSKCWHNLILDK